VLAWGGTDKIGPANDTGAQGAEVGSGEAVESGGRGVVCGQVDDQALVVVVGKLERLVGQPQLTHVGMQQPLDAGAWGTTGAALHRSVNSAPAVMVSSHSQRE
jgi:hypothetical protein